MKRKEPEPVPLPEPPAHLSMRSAALWVATVRRARSMGRRAMLELALECLDRADLAREQSDREGMTFTTTTTGAVHLHPLIRVEKDARRMFAAIWHDDLHLDWDPIVDGRVS